MDKYKDMSNDTSWRPLFWQRRPFSNCFPYLQHCSSSLSKAKVGMLPLLTARVPIRLFPCPSLTVLLPSLGRAMVFHTHLQNHVSWGGTWSFSGLSDAQQSSRPHCPRVWADFHPYTLWAWGRGYLLWLNMMSLSFHGKSVYWVSSKKIELVATHHSQGDFPPCFSSHASLLPFWFFMETVHLPYCARDSSSSWARPVAALSDFLRTGHAEQYRRKLI